MMHATRQLRSLVAVGLLCLLASIAHADDPFLLPTADAPPAITTIPSDGFNLTVEECLPPDRPERVIVNLLQPVHNFFAGTLTNLPTDRELTIGLSMAGKNTKGNKADVSKWRGLRPLLSYADPTRYESYEWFTKDAEGRWVSGDIFNTGEAKFAGTGVVPEQQAIPDAVAAQFLSADGKYWSPWREIDVKDTEVLPALNVFRMKQRFDLPTATVAMRVPYTYTYLQAFIAKLQEAQLPGVAVDTVGVTPEGRKLQVIRVEGTVSTAAPEDRKTILVIAREHANEHASSWALHGMLMSLLTGSAEAERMRQDTTWLFIPIQDPDGSARATFDTLTDRFRKPNDPRTPDEVFDYTRYFTDYVNAGRTLDFVMSLHNVEASECPNIFSPFADARYQDSIIAFNRQVFQVLQQCGYKTGTAEQNWGKGLMTMRLYGWCALHFGSYNVAFEVNDRYPSQPLSLAQLQGIGMPLARCIADWCSSEIGQRWHQQARGILVRRNEARVAHFTREGRKPTDRTKYEMVILGY